MNDASAANHPSDVFCRRLGHLDAGARFFSAVFDQTADPMLVVDDVGHVLAANAAACSLHAVDAREAISLSLADFVPRGVDLRAARRALRDVGSASLEYTEANPKGDVITTRLEGRVVTPQYYVVSFHDVTKERRLESELERAHDGTTVAHTSAAMAHDIGNLLVPILCYLDLLALHPSEPEQNAILTEMRTAAERAASLTKKLLSVARIDAEAPSSLHMNEVIAEMTPMLERLLAPRIELEVRLDPQLGPVEVDRERLERLLLNLVVNARDAMPEGGRLAVETANVMRTTPASSPPRRTQTRSFATFAVIDSGIGMDATTRARIFEPFFTTKPRGAGSGLGLSTALTFVNRNHGYIDVESEHSRGTSFRVGFPSPRASTPPVAPPEKSRDS